MPVVKSWEFEAVALAPLSGHRKKIGGVSHREFLRQGLSKAPMGQRIEEKYKTGLPTTAHRNEIAET